MHDFVVVGAGPAGSRFARTAAERGFDVVVFERGEIGTPLACSGHVSLDIWNYVSDDAREALFQNDIRGARFHLGGPPTRGYPFFKPTAVSNAIDRIALDRHLAELARRAGATVHTNHTVTGVEEHDDRVTVTVTTNGDSRAVEGHMIAGCDGPRSRVRRDLNLPEPTELLHGALGFEATPDHDDFVDVHLTIPRFFAWRIPRGRAGVEYGLAGTPGTDIPGRFDAFTADYSADITNRCSGVIPIGPPDTVTSHRGFLLGDAAAQTKPFTGGGILYGLTAADIAARSIDPHNPASLDSYEQRWRRELRTDQRLGSLIRRAYSLPEPVKRLGLHVASGPIGVHMDRPTSLFSTDHLRALFSR